jgi:hypothetical protein
MNIIDWPESQICIGCIHGQLLSEGMCRYVCDIEAYCNDEDDPRRKVIELEE